VRLVVGITGASGCIYGKRLLQVLQKKRVETHLVITDRAKRIIEQENGAVTEYVGLVSYSYDESDMDAPIVSGSFATDGMVIVPCSMKTLSSLASGYGNNCLTRAADVTLKERRPLVIVLRETPLSAIHLTNMLKLAQAGAVVLPAMPAFYNRPKTIDDLVNFVVGKILDALRVDHDLYERWDSTRRRVAMFL